MLKKEDIAIGLLVYLKSGSPQMVVRGVGEPTAGTEAEIGLVQCVWIVDGEVKTGDFPADCLTIGYPGHPPSQHHTLPF